MKGFAVALRMEHGIPIMVLVIIRNMIVNFTILPATIRHWGRLDRTAMRFARLICRDTIRASIVGS
jgi:hypothetical protein